MKVVIQRVAGASVDIAGERISEIGAGLLILLGVVPDDTEADVDWLIKKCSQMRIFNDAYRNAMSSSNVVTYDEFSSKEALNQLYRSRIEWHRKLAFPVSIMIFFLIGAPLGAIIRKGGLGMPIVISVIFFVIYYIISISGEKWAREGDWSSLMGMWISAIILAPIAVYLTYKATNDSSLLDTDWYYGRYKHYKELLESRLPHKWQEWLHRKKKK